MVFVPDCDLSELVPNESVRTSEAFQYGRLHQKLYNHQQTSLDCWWGGGQFLVRSRCWYLLEESSVRLGNRHTFVRGHRNSDFGIDAASMVYLQLLPPSRMPNRCSKISDMHDLVETAARTKAECNLEPSVRVEGDGVYCVHSLCIA